ncbi:MAG: YciI family protein [Gemmatimonadota bacterium]
MAQFIMLPYETSDAFETMSPAEMQEIIRRYSAWTAGLARRGVLRGGEKLADGTGRVLRGAGEQMSVTDGPHTESKEVIGGFWLVEAKDFDEAVALASDCPHLEFGPLVIREIEQH